MNTELSPKSKEKLLHHVRQLMEFWSITPEDLERACEHVPMPTATPTSAIKYRHPVSRQTWDGNGQHPEWLRQALLKDGYSVAQLKPENQLDTARIGDGPESSPTA